ncbi:hypothetical protein V6N13_098661 [Hibiscus sabdariffa]
MKDAINPILLEEIDESNEWLLGRMENNSSDDENDFFFYDNDGLTWSHVSKAIGAHEPTTSSSPHGRDDEMEEEIGEDDFVVDEDYNDEFDDSE